MSNSPTVAVVTGAARGMGRCCAEVLAGTVDAIVLVDRDVETLEAAAAELVARGADARPFPADVTDRDRIAELASTVRDLGTLRSVAHAAGISPTMAEWRPIFAVDLVGSALLLDALAPLVEPGTAAVCFGSMAGHLVAPGPDPEIDGVLEDPLHPDFLDRAEAQLGERVADSGVAYGLAKRGVQLLVRREAVRWGASGGRVCSVSPGMIETEMGLQEADQQPMMATLLEMSPVPRRGSPEEVAAVVAFLLSDDASFLTGTDVLVDGGVCAALGMG